MLDLFNKYKIEGVMKVKTNKVLDLFEGIFYRVYRIVCEILPLKISGNSHHRTSAFLAQLFKTI